jgi:cyclic pyranopterin phosphate synthase
MNHVSPPLIDRFGRSIEYVRLSVTDRCDMKCSYCLPKTFKGYQEPKDWLTFDEIERVIGAFGRLGTSRVRLTGGEPLLRRNLPELAARLSALPGIRDLSLSTNGTQLPKHAKALRAAGVTRLNISLDSLDRECITQITGRDSIDDVMAGLDAAQDAGFSPIKLNMVVMPGVNEHEVESMTEFCINRGFILRMIETMPMGSTGLASSYAPLGPIVDRLRARFDLIPEIKQMGGGPARYWRTRDGRGQIGVITPISQHFCETCNRVRMAVDGTIYLCLGQEEKVELRPLLRGGISDTELEQTLRDAIELKPEKHEFREAPTKIIRFMSQTGG